VAKILIVDDDPHLLRLFGAKLRSRGYEVHSAGGGAEGVRLAEELEPDLILMDMNMPDVDGREATRRIKAGPRGATPVVALTALTMPDEIEEGLEAGCDGYVVKPISPDELVHELENVLELMDRS
jgi:CheY-like chemotaxis protein